MAQGPQVRDPNWPAVTADVGERPEIDPQLYLHPRTLARLAKFELRAKMIVEGVRAGQHRSPYTGVSVEFAQHRPYVAGDDIRHLDWKVYARSDHLLVKQHRQETNLDLVVLVDSSGSMGFGSRPFSEASGTGDKQSPRGRLQWTKFDHATAIAAGLASIVLTQGDRVGMVVFADEIRSIVNRSSNRQTWRQIVDVLSLHPVDNPTDLGRVLDQSLGKVSNRCLFVVISDFFDDIESTRSALARLKHRGHDAICFQVLDKAEETLAFDEPAPFEGLEGEPGVRVDPRAIRAAYTEALEGHIKQLQRVCRSLGFDHQRVSTQQWLGPTLSAFVARRNALMKRTKHG
ncbi:MAG: DUF58 domain-containing protein [Planctomycetota bacterium]